MFDRDAGGLVITEPSPHRQGVSRPRISVTSSIHQPDEPTSKGGSAECPCCAFPLQQRRIAAQATNPGFGHRLVAVGIFSCGSKTYRKPTPSEELTLEWSPATTDATLGAALNTPINPDRPSAAARGMSAITRYGYAKNINLFSTNQVRLLDALASEGLSLLKHVPKDEANLLGVLVGVAVNRMASFMNLFCRWAPKGEHPVPPFGKNGFPMIWDYAEANPFTDSSGAWFGAIDWIERVLIHFVTIPYGQRTVTSSPAQVQWLPSDTADLFFTDPPYYDSYPYADLSDFFYPILATTCRNIADVNLWFSGTLTSKDNELVLQPTRKINGQAKDHAYYESGMEQALTTGRAVAKPNSVGVIVFANKTTQGWEALLNAIWKSGWVVTGSWPIQTERESRSRSEARLQSSVHLVCRPPRTSTAPFAPMKSATGATL